MSKDANTQKRKDTKVRTKRVATKVTPAVFKDLKMYCVKQETTIEAYMRELLVAGLYGR